MGARNPARYLAPIALVATITATYLILHRGLTIQHSTTSASIPTVTHGAKAHALVRGRYYVVHAGDNLSTIAVKTGVPLSTLQSLNPGVNPTALQVGQRLTLRR
jgi:LysM repeat protein